MEGFFLAGMFYSFLPRNIEPWRAGWQHGDLFVWIAASSAAMTVWGAGRDFSVAILRGIGGAAVGGCASNGAGRDPRNPGKPVKNGLLAIFYLQVFCRRPAKFFR